MGTLLFTSIQVPFFSSVLCFFPTLKKSRMKGNFFFFFFLGPQHMEVPRLGVESELQLPAYTTATATQDLSHVGNHSSRQCQNPDPMSEARSRTRIPTDTSRIHFCCT